MSARAEDSGHALRAAPAGHDSESGAAVGESCVWCGDANVAGQGEVESAAHAVAADGGDDRLRAFFDGFHGGAAELREVECLIRGENGNFSEFGSGGETFFSTSDDGGTEIRVLGENGHVIADLRESPAIQARKFIGGGKSQEQNPVAIYNINGSELIGRMRRQRRVRRRDEGRLSARFRHDWLRRAAAGVRECM